MGESAKLIPHSGRSYGTDTSRPRHDHARHPSGDTAIEGSLKDLAAQHGLNQKIVSKWRKRTFVHDAPMGPKIVRSTVLTAEEEEVVAIRTAMRPTATNDIVISRFIWRFVRI